MQKLIQAKTSVSLSCSFVSLWELEKNNSLGNCADSEKALYVFQKLLELEKSDAPFKDTFISYIDFFTARGWTIFRYGAQLNIGH